MFTNKEIMLLMLKAFKLSGEGFNGQKMLGSTPTDKRIYSILSEDFGKIVREVKDGRKE